MEKVYTHYSYSYATQLVTLDEDGQIEKITAAHDAGKIFNPTLFEGQLEGSIHMGLGYAISEQLEMENGRPKSTRLRKMGILRAKEMPEMEIIGVEVPDPVWAIRRQRCGRNWPGSHRRSCGQRAVPV